MSALAGCFFTWKELSRPFCVAVEARGVCEMSLLPLEVASWAAFCLTKLALAAERRVDPEEKSGQLRTAQRSEDQNIKSHQFFLLVL
jgi:hypothetical protein